MCRSGGRRNLAEGPLRQAVVSPRRVQRRLPGDAATAAVDGPPGIGRVEQHRMDHGPAPVRLAGRARDAGRVQPPAHRGERQAFVPYPGEDLADHPGGVLVDLVARLPAAGLARDVAVAEGRAGQHADGARLGPVPLAAPAALQHLGPLVFREHPLQLQQQVVLGRVPDRPVEEHHRRTGASELLQQQDLVGVAAGEAVRRVDVEGVDARQGDQVAQALQGGADQAGAAVAVVDEQPVVGDGVAVPGGARRQLAQLAVDGVPLSLLVGGDPGVDGHARRGRRDGSRRVGPHGAPLSMVVAGRGRPHGRATAAGARRRGPARPDCRARARSRPRG